MSITALTWTYKKSPLPGNSYIMMVQGSVTGDGSGGTVGDGEDIIGILPTNAVTTVLDAGWFQNDNAGRFCSCGITNSNFEAIFQSTMVATNPSFIAQNDAGYFFSTDNCKVQKFPIYLGHNLNNQFVCSVGCDTNTVGKNYFFWYKFLIELPKL